MDHKHLFLAAGLAVALAAPLAIAAPEAPEEAATETTQELPSAREIIAKYIEATGGEGAYRKLQSRVATGSFEVVEDEMKGQVRIYQQPPCLQLVEVEVPGVGTQSQGVTEEIAWEYSGFAGPRLREGAEREAAHHEALFTPYLDLDEHFKSVETEAIEEVDGEEAYRVRLTPKQAKPTTHWFSTKTGLEVKLAGTAVVQGEDVPFETTISDYRDVDGMKVPFRQEQRLLGKRQVVVFDEVRHNVEFPPDRFDPPAAVKELVEKKQTAAG